MPAKWPGWEWLVKGSFLTGKRKRECISLTHISHLMNENIVKAAFVIELTSKIIHISNYKYSVMKKTINCVLRATLSQP